MGLTKIAEKLATDDPQQPAPVALAQINLNCLKTRCLLFKRNWKIGD